MNNNQYIELKNNSLPVNIKDIPVLDYPVFYKQVLELLKIETNHCLTYHTVELNNKLRLFCCIANDNDKNIYVFSHELSKNQNSIKSITPECRQLQIFEREIHENYGINFEGHPWLKPVRYPKNRSDKSKIIENYPFYEIESEELHEVGVGPIHAGIIEPGHFRFICNGEKVLHLEIQLGYQHRGIEKLFAEKNNSLTRCVISDSIAGDSSVGHSFAHSQLVESLSDIEISESLQIERCIALELERIAVHIGDTAALCTDVAYQFGQIVNEALRTTIINTTQFWCGNRFGKGLVRPGGSNYPLNEKIITEISMILADTGKRYCDITDLIYTLPSVLARFDGIGVVTKNQALSIGAVGMVARTCGIQRDIRNTHPFQFYNNFPVKPVILKAGDVLARGMMRNLESRESIKIINDLLEIWQQKSKINKKPVYNYKLKPNCFAISMVEGWRGEICHIAITDNDGEIFNYKVNDPSVHNWMALALAVRNQEISDFPICNKSFNLSYCGNDL
ncbi:MAG: NADH-quinone oxidoreductase subunit C [Bacteroidota bacterium]